MRLPGFVRCALVLAAIFPPDALARYRYYLDARRAEETMAGLTLGRRLFSDEWVNIVGTRKDEKYKIRRGDTLWRISSRKLGSPRYWRKLWQINPFILNPHDLEVGTLLKYYNEGPDAKGDTPETFRVPLVKLVPGGSGSASDLDNDSYVNHGLKNRYRPIVVVVEDQEIIGEVTGAYTEREWLSQHDSIYATFFSPGVLKKGDTYSIVRFERAIVDSSQTSRPVIGNLMRVVGEYKITAFGETFVVGELSGQYGIVKRGDALIRVVPTVSTSIVFFPPSELSVRVVMGEEAERKVFAQGDLVLLNKGTSDGMKEGYLFRVYRDQDLSTGLRAFVEPSSKGEIQVIQAGQFASVGYIVRNSEPILLADTGIPSQAFLDPPPPPSRASQSLELTDSAAAVLPPPR